MQAQDVTLIGHINSSSLYSLIIEDERTWSSFLFDNCRMEKENLPKVDFATRKVVLIPSYYNHNKTFLVYRETLKDQRKKSLELNFMAYRNDAASQRIFKNALIVLDLPKEEKFHVFVDPVQHTITEKDEEILDLIVRTEHNVKQIKGVESALMIINQTLNCDAPILKKILTELQATQKELSWYDNIVKERVKALRKTLLGNALNSRDSTVSK